MRDLITSLSKQFINIPEEEIGQLIRYTLEESGRRMNLDWCFVLSFSGNQRSYEMESEWHCAGCDSILGHVHRLSMFPQRWSSAQLRDGEMLEVSRLEDLRPAESILERELFQQAGIGAMVLIPMRINNQLLGLLGMAFQRGDNTGETGNLRTHWTADELAWMRSLAEMLTNVLGRLRAQRLQNATFQIAQASFAAQNLDDLSSKIHQILGNLMPVDNFFLALYNQDKNLLEFPYYVDQFDPRPQPQRPGHGITEYVLRTGKPLWAPETVFRQLIASGEIDQVGEPCMDWIGVPLIVRERTIGVMAAQSYTEGVRFSEYELNILSFVSTQVAMVIERKLAEQQLQQALNDKETLLREIHRRVRNNLQVVSSLISLQAEEFADEHSRNIFDHIQSRIRAMAMVHEELYRSADFGNMLFDDYAENLAQTVYLAYSTNPGIRMHVEVDAVEFSLEAAIPCGLILHELLIHCFERAFSTRAGGEIWIQMRVDGGDCSLVVRDNGEAHLVEGSEMEARTFGLQLVEILTRQLHGEMSIRSGEEDGGRGRRVEIVFPAPVPSRRTDSQSGQERDRSPSVDIPVGMDSLHGGKLRGRKGRLFGSEGYDSSPEMRNPR